MFHHGALEKKLVSSDEDIKDPKKSSDPRTWFNRGELFQDINDVNTEFLRLGMGSSEVQLFLKAPKEVKTVEKVGLFNRYMSMRE